MSSKTDNAGKKGVRTGYVSTIIGISLVLFMIGLVFAATMGLGSLQRQARENLQGDLFFDASLNEADIKQIELELKAWDCFSEVWFVSPDKAIEEFSGTDQNSKEILEIFDGENPLPATVSFRPKESFATKTGMAKIQQRIMAAFEGQVTEVNYDKASVEDVNLGFRQFAFLFLAIAGLLIIVAVAMINNTIRLALYSRRFTIKTMQLVGATSSFIRRPFIRTALGQGVTAACIGMALLMTLFFALNNVLDVIEIEMSMLQFLMLFGTILLAGILLTIISTFFALNRYLRKKLDDLY